MKKGIRKVVAVLLSMALVYTGMGVPAYAEQPLSDTGLCEHHPQHDQDCGYVAPVEGHDCTHQHTDDCYVEVETATPSAATPGSGTEKVLDCPHAKGQHDDKCGYVEAVEGRPCGYLCEKCGTIPYMDENGTMHHDKVGRENIRTVSKDDYIWSVSEGTPVWYYLKESQTFSNRIEISEGDVNLVLGRGATLTADFGIYVAEGASLTIYGQDRTDGCLKAYGASWDTAAIGGGERSDGTAACGRIVINSGTVYAGPRKGGSVDFSVAQFGSSGIGAGTGTSMESEIQINGGKVTAEGVGPGPGIGGGGSSVKITGGEVHAVGGTSKGGDTVSGSVYFSGAGIGGGDSFQCGTIEISGGTVTAVGGTGSSGIGAGRKGTAGGSITVSGAVKLTARGDRAAIDEDLTFAGAYDGDYMVIGNEQNAEGGVVTEFRVNGDSDSLPVPITGYRYLKAEPRTWKSVAVSPQSAGVNAGQQVSFSVMTDDGIRPEADATEILKTVWSLSSGTAGYQPAGSTGISGGVLTIGGDEELEKLTVKAACVLPDGVKMVRDTADVTVYQTKYTVSFDANGGQTDAAPLLTTMGRLTEALPTASRTGYTFIGWYTDRPAEGAEIDTSRQINGNTVYTHDTTLYAGWRANLYTVTYNSMGGSTGTFTRSVSYGGHAPKPAVPVRDLAVFEGWYTDLSYTRRWDFDRDIVTGDMRLYARWSDAVLDVTVSAEAVPAYGGEVLYAGRYRSGSTVVLEAKPNSGYRFLCWTKAGEVVSTDARYLFTLEEDTVLKAEFVWAGISGGEESPESSSSGGSTSSSNDSSSNSLGGSSGGSIGGGGASGGNSSGAVSGGPVVVPAVPTVIPGSGSEISTVVAVADAAAMNIGNAQSVAGVWFQNEQGWVLQVGGAAATNSWVCVAERDGAHWYHFGVTGLMDTGWLELDGKRYYLYANHDSTEGRMLTGWQLLDGKWYYFSSVNDATLGSLLTDTVTPDGYRVNAQGEWIQ